MSRRSLVERRPSVGRRSLADAGLAVGALLALVLAVVALLPPGDTDAATADAPATASPRAEPAADADGNPDGSASLAERLLQGRIRAALGATVVPSDLEPAVGRLGPVRWAADAGRTGCLAVDPTAATSCLTGPRDAPTTTVLIGDRAAIGYLPAVRGALSTGLVQQLTLPGCSPFAGPAEAPGSRCGRFASQASALIDRLDPDLVLISSTSAYARLGDAADADGVTGAIQAVSAPGRLVAVLGEPPGAGDLTQCAGRGRLARDCEQPIDDARRVLTATERSRVEAAGAAYVDPEAWFCLDGRCPAFVGTTPVYADGTRLTQAYSRELTGVMRDALVEVVAAG